MSKAKIIDKKSVESILGEKRILSELYHPFIVNMIYSFQDSDYLYLVMELLSGGNLRYNLSINRTFNENQIRFIIGCILTGLKYIHGKNILHRDIKPENLVFDSRGYLRITDFGIAKHYVINNKKDTSGTVGYLAPEVLCNVNHNFSIDYYALGIIAYELMFGHRPYIGKNKHEVKQLILTKQAKVDYDDLPLGFSNDIADFINKLIQRKPKNRLGKNNIEEVLNHAWLENFEWDNCYSKKLKAPYIPKYGDNFDKNFCLKSNQIGTETMARYESIMKKEDINNIFKDFNCSKIPIELKGKKKTENKISINNNVSSNMSTTSISRNNKNDYSQKNKGALSNIKEVDKNLIKNKIMNNGIAHLGIKNSNKSIDEIIKDWNNIKKNDKINTNILDGGNKTIRNNPENNNNNNYLELTFKKQNYYFNILNSQKNEANVNNKEEKENININIEKNELKDKDKALIHKKMHRNISAKNIYRDKYNVLNNSSIYSKIDYNLGFIKNGRPLDINSYKFKKDKYQNSKMRRSSSNIYNTKSQMNKRFYLKNKKNTNIIIPRTKKDFIKKELLKNKSILYQLDKNQNELNIHLDQKSISSLLMSSTFYPNQNDKLLNNSRMNTKKFIQNNSTNNLFEDRNKNKIQFNLSSRNTQNVSNNEKVLPTLSLSMNKIKKNKNEHSVKGDIFFKFNKYKNNFITGRVKTRNGLNYDIKK